MGRIRILDLYAGMGGLSLGFLLGIEGAEALGLEIDRYAVETYNRNLSRLGGRAEQADLLEREPRGDYDIVVGGPPCQPWSTANYRKRGPEHPLFPTLARFFDIVLALEPRAFLMENVRGLVSRRNIGYLEEQLRRIRGRYRVAWRVLDAADYGVPQRRKRLFVLGLRRDLGREPSFPAPTHSGGGAGGLAPWVTVREAIGDLLSVPPLGYPKKLVQTNPRHGRPVDMGRPSYTVKVDGRGGDFTYDTMLIPLSPEQAERIRRERMDTRRHWGRMRFPDPLDEPSRTVSSHTIEGAKRETIVLPVLVHTGDAEATILAEHVGGTVLRPETLERIRRSGVGLRVHEPGEPAKTVKAVTGGPQNTEPYVRAGPVYRRLTVREALRLQSFPDWWTFPGHVSLTRRYRMVGEAVPPVLAYRLAVHVARLLGLPAREPPDPAEWALPYFRRAFEDYYRGREWAQTSSPRRSAAR